MVRGEWGGDSEERGLQELLKDTWTKSRERVEVGEGGAFSWDGVEG